MPARHNMRIGLRFFSANFIDSRQIDFEGGAFTDFAVNPDCSLALLNNSVDR